MKLGKPVLAALAAVTIGGVSLFGVHSVLAQSADGEQTLVEKIADHFNLNQNEVQSVFDEFRQEREAKRQEELSQRLQEKVDNGTITAEQKTLIEEKLAELHDQLGKWREQDLSREEIRTQIKQTREDLKQWAKENGIPEDVLPRPGMHHHPGSGSHGEED